MIPVMMKTYNQAVDMADDLYKQAECLKQDFWTTLITDEYIREVEASPVGLLIYPLSDPRRVANFFNGFAKLVFTRQKDDSGLYQWITTFDEYGIQLWIMANENVDLTGTAALQPLNV